MYVIICECGIYLCLCVVGAWVCVCMHVWGCIYNNYVYESVCIYISVVMGCVHEYVCVCLCANVCIVYL